MAASTSRCPLRLEIATPDSLSFARNIAGPARAELFYSEHFRPDVSLPAPGKDSIIDHEHQRANPRRAARRKTRRARPLGADGRRVGRGDEEGRRRLAGLALEREENGAGGRLDLRDHRPRLL